LNEDGSGKSVLVAHHRIRRQITRFRVRPEIVSQVLDDRVLVFLAHDTGSDHRFVGEDPALSGEHFLDSGTPRRFISETPLMKSPWTVAAQAIKLNEITTPARWIQGVEIDNPRGSLRRPSNASIVLLGAGA